MFLLNGTQLLRGGGQSSLSSLMWADTRWGRRTVMERLSLSLFGSLRVLIWGMQTVTVRIRLTVNLQGKRAELKHHLYLLIHEAEVRLKMYVCPEWRNHSWNQTRLKWPHGIGSYIPALRIELNVFPVREDQPTLLLTRDWQRQMGLLLCCTEKAGGGAETVKSIS